MIRGDPPKNTYVVKTHVISPTISTTLTERISFLPPLLPNHQDAPIFFFGKKGNNNIVKRRTDPMKLVCMTPNAQLSGGCRRSKAEPEAVRCSVWFGGC